jgi:dihydroorotate dehydrogenase (NAD+) catalytic subunit
MNLATNFCGIKLANPLVLASGILGVTGSNLAAVIENGAGAVTTKSIWLTRHEGHKNPTVLQLGNGNLINAVGLPHGGIEEAREEIENFRRLSPAPLFASVVAASVEEFFQVTEAVAELKPDLIEVNISCPNVEDELGRPFACEPKLAERATTAVKKAAGKIPVSVKLSPNVSNISEIAKAVEAAGASAITAINTVGPGMIIDIETAEPILANRVGGLSGPAIRPLAIKCVYDIFHAVKIPIIGTGGVSNGRDALEMLLAGATLIGIGSAVASQGLQVFGKINVEIEKWCETQGVKDLKEIVGRAQKN